jgi:hypothetical protein
MRLCALGRRHLEAQGLGEGKRGPGRPPQRLSSQASFGSARSGGAVGSGRRGRGSGVGRHSAIALELAPETNELIGRRIWCAAQALPCGAVGG